MARAASISTPKDNLRQDNKRISGSNRAFLPFPHEISGNLSLEVKICGFFCLLHLSCKAQLAGGGLLRSQNQKKQQLLCAKSLWSMVRMHHCRQGCRDARKLFEPIWANLKLFVEPCWATIHIFSYPFISCYLHSWHHPCKALTSVFPGCMQSRVRCDTMCSEYQPYNLIMWPCSSKSSRSSTKPIYPMKRQMSCVDGLSWRIESSWIH